MILRISKLGTHWSETESQSLYCLVGQRGSSGEKAELMQKALVIAPVSVPVQHSCYRVCCWGRLTTFAANTMLLLRSCETRRKWLNSFKGYLLHLLSELLNVLSEIVTRPCLAPGPSTGLVSVLLPRIWCSLSSPPPLMLKIVFILHNPIPTYTLHESFLTLPPPPPPSSLTSLLFVLPWPLYSGSHNLILNFPPISSRGLL